MISDILANHRFYEGLINKSTEGISNDITSNMNYLKEHEPWIGNLLLGKFNHSDMMPYFLSENYKSRLAIHSTLVYGNLEPQLQTLQTINKKVIEQLEDRLEHK